MSLRVGSLFSGIGGFDLGFERAGMKVAWQCEIDKHARQVLTKHWPGVPCYEDVRAVSANLTKNDDIVATSASAFHTNKCTKHCRYLPPVDVICFGSPCQDLSVAGKRAGMAGERSGLFFEAVRIIKEMREASGGRFPGVAVWENVPGAFSSEGGADFGAALDALADSGAVDIAWRVIDAQHWVPQRRRRVFVVACYPPVAYGRAGIGRAGQVLALAQGVLGHPAPSREAGEDVAGTLGGSSQSGGFRTTDGTGAQGVYVPDVVGALSDGAHHGGGLNGQDAYTGRVLSLGRPRRLTPRECERLQGFPDDWTAGQADSHRYRQLGNAVAVPVGEWIGRRIVEAAR